MLNIIKDRLIKPFKGNKGKRTAVTTVKVMLS